MDGLDGLMLMHEIHQDCIKTRISTVTISHINMLAVHRPSSAVSNGDTVQIPMMVASFQKRFPSLSRDTTAARFHTHEVGPNQCCSAVVQEISAPISTVWSVVRRFDNPQAYKHFLKSCSVIGGDGGNVGSLRQVHVVSGLPAASSTERLDILDDERHVISFSVVGGDHRLSNYRSVTTLHPSPISGTVVVESYVVDVPQGNTKEETCDFVDVIVRCNLQSLAKIVENSAAEVKKKTSM
ncbi:hypothetical protein Bca4012_029108 [Brassica carinata]